MPSFFDLSRNFVKIKLSICHLDLNLELTNRIPEGGIRSKGTKNGLNYYNYKSTLLFFRFRVSGLVFEDFTSDYMSVIGMLFSMFGLMMRVSKKRIGC